MIRRLAATFLSITLAAGAASAQQLASAPAGPPSHRRMPPGERHTPSHEALVHALRLRRAENLARFHAYRTKGVYPHDDVAQTTENMWRDDDGHLCAAATILDQDGQHDLVMDTAASDNGVKLGEVTSGALLDWILTSGFTQVEIATIQEPFEGPRRPVAQNADWKIAEDARLKKTYARIEASLKASTDDALEQAADRLAKSPDLAWKLIGEVNP